jgi:hypothetical protein
MATHFEYEEFDSRDPGFFNDIKFKINVKFIKIKNRLSSLKSKLGSLPSKLRPLSSKLKPLSSKLKPLSSKLKITKDKIIKISSETREKISFYWNNCFGYKPVYPFSEEMTEDLFMSGHFNSLPRTDIYDSNSDVDLSDSEEESLLKSKKMHNNNVQKYNNDVQKYNNNVQKYLDKT